MLPEAPSSDYFMLTLIIVVTGVVPLIVSFVVLGRLQRRQGEVVTRRLPRWFWWAAPLALAAWWFVAAWLFLND